MPIHSLFALDPTLPSCLSPGPVVGVTDVGDDQSPKGRRYIRKAHTRADVLPLFRHSNSRWRLPINWLPSKHQALRPSEPHDWSAFCIHDERRTTRVSSRDPVAFKPPRSPRARIEGGSTRAGPWSRRSGSRRLRARCGAGRLRCHPVCGCQIRGADRTNNRSKRDGCEVRLIDGALGGSFQRRPLSPLRMWRWTLETERSRETAVACVAVAAWRQAVVSTGAVLVFARRRGALC